MLIFPELQISNGKVITRSPGQNTDIVHDMPPLQCARWFEGEGAERLHVVDVDAARGAEQTNAELITRILEQTLVPVQVAGGIRTLTQIEEWWRAGAATVVLGTIAITDPSLVADVANRHPGAILVNLATKDGFVMIDGWRTKTAFRPQDIVYDLQMTGVAGIIHTDIDRFRDDGSESLVRTMELNQDVVIPVYSSGTVHSLDDIAILRYLPNISGVIVGHALLNHTFSLAEALEVASQTDTTPTGHRETTPVSAQGIQQTMRVYLSGYSNSQAARWWNRSLRQALTDTNPYLEMVIPQEDLEVDERDSSPREIQKAYEDAIESAEAVVVLLDGIENEAWTGFECGYARARGKYLLGVAASDGRDSSTLTRFHTMCDEIVTFEPGEDWTGMLGTIAKDVSSRLLLDQAS